MFNVEPDGETGRGVGFTRNLTVKQAPGYGWSMDLTERQIGFLIGILVGEGHFGGDGKQPQISLRMHTKHERLFRWLESTVPGGRLYGPYAHGGRSYFQWMIRGSSLREGLVPLIQRNLDLLDGHTEGRFLAMCERYRISLTDE